MTEKNNAVCSICGSEYYVCLSCKDKMELHPYKVHCCSPSHFQVFQIVRGLSTGVYTKDEAKEKLRNVDLNDLDSYRGHIKDIVKDILKEEKVVIKAAKKIENTVVEDIKDVEVGETETSEVIEDIAKPTVSRKRNYKVETE